MHRLDEYSTALRGMPAAEVVAWAVAQWGPERVALASSLGPEDQVLTEMLAGVEPRARLFSLDTGRQFQETYDLMQETARTYRVQFEVYAPAAAEVEELVRRDGPNGLYESLEKRRACCEVRKVRPLRRVLATVDAWICGLRRDQGPTRAGTGVIEWDDAHGVYKLCPLFDWREEDVWRHLLERRVPFSALHRRGYRSIGCAPCTRPIAPGEDPRAGRWWWESAEKRECGLHRAGGQ